MATPKFVQFAPRPLERFRPMVGEEEFARVEATAERAREAFSGRAIWHVNSTMRGGGVAEMLHALLPYVRGAGVDTRWIALRESPEFFALTKRLHNHLHGVDGEPLGDEGATLYRETLATTASNLAPLVQAGDVVFLHDPQTLGLAPGARAAGAGVVWRCHIGVDRPNDVARAAWEFLSPYLAAVDAFVFSRREYVWDSIDRDAAWIMPPSIDPFSPKNQELDEEAVRGILGVIGLGPPPAAPPTFERADGTPSRVERPAEVLQEGHLPEGEPVALQVSRWDKLKDHRGLLDCFDRHLGDRPLHLILAGPASGAVADDPEGAAVWAEIVAAWPRLKDETRRRVHIVSLPMEDLEENGAMVNALQRRATVVVQKSIAEGFGLTVSEAMWKGKPVVGTRVGGIQDQVADGETGLLVDDPHDLAGFAEAIWTLVGDPERAERMGRRARRRVLDRYLGSGRLIEYVNLVSTVVDARLQSPSSP